MPDLLSIGDFSQACRLSVKTLRRYADQGLLTPAWIDPDTSYRYYRPVQVIEAERIRVLRELELPLAEVREVLQTQDPEAVAAILARHREHLETRIAAQQRALERLRDLEQGPVPAVMRHEERAATHALALRRTIDLPGLMREVSPVLRRIGQSLLRRGSRAAGTPFVRYHGEDFDPDALDVEIGVPTAEPVEGEDDLHPVTLPGGSAAVTLHAGPYSRIGEAYAVLFSWMDRSGLRPAGPAMETYVVSPKHGVPPNAFRTEVSFPVAARLPSTPLP